MKAQGELSLNSLLQIVHQSVPHELYHQFYISIVTNYKDGIITAMETLSPAPPVEKPSVEKLHPVFVHNTYEVTRRLGRIGTTFDFTDGERNFLMRTRREPFHFTNKFHLYEDKDRERELLSFNTRGTIPQTYDIHDPAKKTKIGSIRHNLSDSFPRTSWEILSPNGDVIGTLKRNKMKKSWDRYGAKAVMYPSFDITDMKGNVVSTIEQKFSLIGQRYKTDIKETDTNIDRRLLVAANVVVAEREFRKQSS